jgi:hypothetical protein
VGHRHVVRDFGRVTDQTIPNPDAPKALITCATRQSACVHLPPAAAFDKTLRQHI